MTRSPAALVIRAVSGGARTALRGRTLVAVVAIAFGVALGYAVELINAAAVDELRSGLAVLAGHSDLEVRGPRGGFDEGVYARVARDADVADASPVVELEAKLRDRREPLTILGVDVFRTLAVNPALVAQADDRLDTLRGDAIFPSAAAAQWLGVAPGDHLVVQAGSQDIELRVGGRAGIGGGSRYAVMDIAALQDRFARSGVVTRIDLRLRPGASIETVRERVQALLPPGVHVARPAESAEASARFSRAYRVNLNVLALVALFTGALLVYATQALGVVRRRSQFALLRALGLTRRRLVAVVVGEAALLGVVGAAAGLAAGYAIAAITLQHFGTDLGAGFFRGRAVAPPLEPHALALFATLGIAAAVAGSAWPAREAARAAPAAALKAADADIEAPAHTARVAVALIVAGALVAWLPSIDDLPVFGYASIAAILLGGILALPTLARPALRALRSPRAVPVSLALAYLRATPGRFSATLAAVVASVSLMISMAIMVASFRQSLDDWLAHMLPADLYVRTTSDTGWFAPPDQRAIAGLPGVARVEFMRVTAVSVDPSRPRIVVLARDIDPRDPSARLALVGTPVTPAPGTPPPAWISEAVADTQTLAPGSVFRLPLAGHAVAFTVAGVWRDYARQQGAVVIERARFRALTGDDTVNEAAVWLTPGAALADVRDAIAVQAGGEGRVQVATAGDLRTFSLATFDRTFAVTYALEAAAVVIGLVGLSAALIAQTLARSREFGMLRHIGMTRREIGRMLAFEGATLAAFGVASGLALGFAISLILIHVVNRQSFHWGMDLHVPWLELAALCATLLVLATLAARLAARSATSVDAVRAVRDDW
jgi:putative ABC transport system permease protein